MPALFKREEGFFVGAILANVVTTELVILLVCFFFLLVIGAQYSSVLILLFVMALIFPVLFYHHSWSLWLGSISSSNRCRSTTLNGNRQAVAQKQTGLNTAALASRFVANRVSGLYSRHLACPASQVC